jgi:hypothetical protein
MSAEFPPEIRSQLNHRLNEMGKGYGFILTEVMVTLPIPEEL